MVLIQFQSAEKPSIAGLFGTDVYNESICKRAIYPEIKKHLKIYSAKYKSLYTITEKTCIAVTPIIMKKAYRDGKVEYNVRGRFETVRLQELQGGKAMDYITPKEDSIKWGISERRIQKLCEEGRIDGVVRFGKV